MSYRTNGLTFNTLRGANTARLPEFKNKKGEPAHDKPDGSDWNPAQWLQALIGEIGEFARVRIQYEAGALTPAEYKVLAEKELADVQTYLDILALRALDKVDITPGTQRDAAQILMQVVASVGEYANERKKFDRREMDINAFRTLRHKHLTDADSSFSYLNLIDAAKPNTRVTQAHRSGVDLGQATVSKFNEVSDRVGSGVYMDAEDWHYRKPSHPKVSSGVQDGTDRTTNGSIGQP